MSGGYVPATYEQVVSLIEAKQYRQAVYEFLDAVCEDEEKRLKQGRYADRQACLNSLVKATLDSKNVDVKSPEGRIIVDAFLECLGTNSPQEAVLESYRYFKKVMSLMPPQKSQEFYQQHAETFKKLYKIESLEAMLIKNVRRYLATIIVLVSLTPGMLLMLVSTKVPSASGDGSSSFAITSHSPNRMCASRT